MSLQGIFEDLVTAILVQRAGPAGHGRAFGLLSSKNALVLQFASHTWPHCSETAHSGAASHAVLDSLGNVIEGLAEALLTHANRIWSQLVHQAMLHCKLQANGAAAGADDLGEQVVALDKQAIRAAECLALVAYMYDHATAPEVRDASKAAWTCAWARHSADAATYVLFLTGVFRRYMCLDELICALSELFALLKVGAPGGGVACWKPPSVFRRRTTKFWLTLDSETAVKVKVAQHMPVLSFGQVQGQAVLPPVVELLAMSGDDVGRIPRVESVSGRVSSRYFDNRKFEVYDARLKRFNEASLVRVRWYGTATFPVEDAEVFLERKVHMDSWTGEPSVKERTKLTAGAAEELFQLARQGQLSQFLGVASAGRCGLLDEIVGQLNKTAQEPTVSTTYKRTAYQLSTENSVRLSIDSHIQMFRSLSRDGCAAPTAQAVLPFSVLEIKLQEHCPEWVGDLVSNTPGLTYGPKFSKFLHATSLLFQDQVACLPPWYLEGEGGHYRPATFDEWKLVIGDADMALYALARSPDVVSEDGRPEQGEAQAQFTLSELADALLRKKSASARLGGTNGASRETLEVPHGEASRTPETGSFGTSQADPCNGHQPAGAESHDPELGTLVEMRPSGSITHGAVAGASKSARVRSMLRRFFQEKRRNTRSVVPKPVGNKKPAKPILRTRIEPKTLFANERTFLSWLSVSVLIMLIAISLAGMQSQLPSNTLGPDIPSNGSGGGGTICHYGSTNPACVTSKVSALIIGPVSISFMVYALVMYKLRTRRILRREDNRQRFDDKLGPVVLTLLLIFACVTALILTIVSSW
ncbi:unnamed protein product [Pedinophyceae sp. YPF-701]|nr:unnamed protein product [Pedinophyceae sp. YPF-701]